jgi:hypothetical protein
MDTVIAPNRGLTAIALPSASLVIEPRRARTR